MTMTIEPPTIANDMKTTRADDAKDTSSSSFQLKAVLKENHGCPVVSLEYYKSIQRPEYSNLLASVGGHQLNVYDDRHMGEHLAVVAQYCHVDGDDNVRLTCSSWLTGPVNNVGHVDPRIAVGSVRGEVVVVSLVESKVEGIIPAGETEIVGLSAALSATGELTSDILAVLTKDGCLRLWNTVTKEPVVDVIAEDATAVYMSAHGDALLVGTRQGSLLVFDIIVDENMRHIRVQQNEQKSRKGLCSGPVENICMSMESDTILLRSGTDVVSVLDSKKLGEQGSPVRCKVVVPHASDRIDGKCLVDLDPQGTLFVAGNHEGDAFLYASENGDLLNEVSVVRVSAPVRAAVISDDAKHILLAAGDGGFMFRFVRTAL